MSGGNVLSTWQETTALEPLALNKNMRSEIQSIQWFVDLTGIDDNKCLRFRSRKTRKPVFGGQTKPRGWCATTNWLSLQLFIGHRSCAISQVIILPDSCGTSAQAYYNKWENYDIQVKGPSHAAWRRTTNANCSSSVSPSRATLGIQNVWKQSWQTSDRG